MTALSPSTRAMARGSAPTGRSHLGCRVAVSIAVRVPNSAESRDVLFTTYSVLPSPETAIPVGSTPTETVWGGELQSPLRITDTDREPRLETYKVSSGPTTMRSGA